MEQVNFEKTQAEALCLSVAVPPWMERCLLLIVPWSNTQYRDIALEFTMDDKSVTVETLVRELQKLLCSKGTVKAARIKLGRWCEETGVPESASRFDENLINKKQQG